MKRRARLKDIAEMTGFSTNTVSLALHRSPLVAEETSKLIWATAKQLNYRPNHLARSLVSSQSKSVGLVITNIQNPILTRAAEAIQGVLAEHGYATLFANSNRSLDDEKNALDVFMGRQVDGILIYPHNPFELSHIAEIVAYGTPVVMLAGTAGAQIDTVSTNGTMGARLATEHLIRLGHRRIALIVNSVSLGNHEKLAGYLQAHEVFGLAVDENLIIDPLGFGGGQGYAAMEGLMSRNTGVTAAVAANDMLAMGALHWCHAAMVRVPEQFSIVGMDNIELSAHATPPLTTVNYAAEDLSRRAVERLLALIEGDLPVQVDLLEPWLVIRSSTAEPASPPQIPVTGA